MSMPPFNIELLRPTEDMLTHFNPIIVLDSLEGSSKNFHPNGLFSTQIFGRVSEDKRNTQFAYIKLKVDVLHPIIFEKIIGIKSFYKDIMAGKQYAVFIKEKGVFEKSTLLEGSTGFSFFMSHVNELVLEKNTSSKRINAVKLLDKYRNNYTYKYLIVMPAGLRDYEVDDTGRPSKAEVNDFYLKILSISNLIDEQLYGLAPKEFDIPAYNLQIAVVDLYLYLESLLEGKGKLILGKFLKRKIHNGTRNVITSYTPDIEKFSADLAITTNSTVVGLYQYMMAIAPLVVFKLKDLILSKVFTVANGPVYLINKDTYKKEYCQIKPEYYDDWMTYEGLQGVIARYEQEDSRHDYVEIDGRYIALMYKGPDKTYKIFQDIDDLPEGLDKKYVLPLTYTEMFYCAVYKTMGKYPAFVVRYPITGHGSAYPCYPYLKSTTRFEVRTELDENWQASENVALEFPIVDADFYASMSIDASHLSRAGGDNSIVN